MSAPMRCRCMVCGAPSGLQLLCSGCSARERSRGLTRIAEIVREHELRLVRQRRQRIRERLFLLVQAALMALVVWAFIYALLWLDNGRSVIR